MNNWYDILEITQIGHRLFVSGYARAASLAKENPHKITAVLCVHQIMNYEKNPDIEYKHIGFPDKDGIPRAKFVECLGWLKAKWDEGHTILIHCAAGISRSVTILTSFMHYEGIMEFHKALDMIKLNRPNAGPQPDILRSAKQMLGVYPYDGSYDTEAEHQKSMPNVIEMVQAHRTAMQHPDVDCPMRLFLLSGEENKTPRHQIPCTCQNLLTPLDRARIEHEKEKSRTQPSEPVDFTKLERKVDGDVSF